MADATAVATVSPVVTALIAGVSALSGTLVGLAGQWVAQRTNRDLAKTQRDDARSAAQRELRRVACESCDAAAHTLRETLIDRQASPPSAASDVSLSKAKSRFDAEIARLDDQPTQLALRAWSKSAIQLANAAISAEVEDTNWIAAMNLLGATRNGLN